MSAMSVKAKSLFNTMLHLFLLGGALIFVKQNIDDYIEGSTGYSASQEHITLNDLPTLTICFEIKKHFEKALYGKDFVINANVLANELESVTLLENGTMVSFSTIGLSLQQNELVLSNNASSAISWQCGLRTKNNKNQCFKITSKARSKTVVNFQHFRMQLVFKYSSKAPLRAHVLVTSEGNSYGAAWGKMV